MDGLQIRQGTVYGEIATGRRCFFIHHNPMALESMRLAGDAETFDCAHPEIVSVDSLIELRKDPAWRELGDVPPEVFQQILAAVLAAPGLADETRQALVSLQNQECK